jgi:hypothetical protein
MKKMPKPRNPYVESARLRKAGKHEDKKSKFNRRISRLEVSSELDKHTKEKNAKKDN